MDRFVLIIINKILARRIKGIKLSFMGSVNRPVILVIRDGWGESQDDTLDRWNAIKHGNARFHDNVLSSWPCVELAACGLDVGLPEGIMGNSEVGHQNIGAGRIVDQEIVRIDKAFASGTASGLPALRNALANVIKNDSKLHLFGLCSDGGVHSMLRHLYSLLTISKAAGLKDVCIHFFADGRDTPPKSGRDFLKELEARCKEIGIGTVETVIGRFWAMDRDNRWARVEKAYSCLTGGYAKKASNAMEAIEDYYQNPLEKSQTGDEFITPTQIVGADGVFDGAVEDGDSVVFFNFRGDRPRELTRAFIDDEFQHFDRGRKLDLFYATMTEYESDLCSNVIFERNQKMKNILGSYVSDLGIRQFRCAETEKYAHVTFFFNDYREEPFPLEDRKLIPSPNDVPTYDKVPAMSALAVKDAVIEALKSEKYGLIVVNFANTDMVGHTGNFEAAKQAVAVVDSCVEQICMTVDRVNAIAVITADHGNSEQMWDPKNNVPHTQHTLNPVKLTIYGNGCNSLKLRKTGRLADIAPTVLQLMNLPSPPEMTGNSLIIES
ncbi:MAG: 2,3-bisphosphoglycerate-independent phosphoglycerate mutase [Puniceicoccales bacterium]|jgi:2,3-bisphosphoglycerate-independent phosphoglycerate mutase|nr:2,3-bisphosphoglycerate-independent phosphoglycerate mutase [Puniceicoccales bacterium]